MNYFIKQQWWIEILTSVEILIRNVKAFNSLRPSDAIWWHRNESTLAQLSEAYIDVFRSQWVGADINATCHYRDVMASEITGNSTFCSIFC